ncbi:MAG: hypothetical protein JNL70_07560 [Saprospiraceae bacterium]|nr:hypothetical protein [Saprospiraceae bacterium]
MFGHFSPHTEGVALDKNKAMEIIKWIARILGFAASIFFLSFFIGEVVPDLIAGKATDLIPFLPLFLLAVLGYVLTWFNTFYGGWTLVLGGAAMWVYQLIENRDWYIATVFGAPFLMVGVLFLIYWHKVEFSASKNLF